MRKAIYVAVLAAMLASACAPAGGGFRAGFRLTQEAAGGAGLATDIPVATDTPIPADTATPIPQPSETPTVTPQAFPVVTFTINANCRRGPGVNYYHQTAYTAGQTAEVDGRNEDATWLWVRMEDNRDFCWISASTVKDFGGVSALSVIPYQLLPADPLVSIGRVFCSHTNVVEIDWTGVTQAQGFRIYHRGEWLYTKDPTIRYVLDYPPNEKTYEYSVEAYNEVGVSHRISITVPGC